MTDQTPETPTEQPQAAAQGDVNPTPPTDTETAPKAVSGPPAEPAETPNREAARYRTQLREAEAERDDARAQLARIQGTMLARALARADVTPEAVAAAGYGFANLADDDGNLDADKLTAAVADTAARIGVRAGTTPDRGLYVASQGQMPERISTRQGSDAAKVAAGMSSGVPVKREPSTGPLTSGGIDRALRSALNLP